MTHHCLDTGRVRRFIGGKGLNHRLAWEHIPAQAGPFDPENGLLISVGPLTGTPAPTSGRTEIGGIAAQTYPPMYAHSGVGGWFGAELKYAGYDSLVITGQAPSPIYLWIRDDAVEIRDAAGLWGLGTFDAQQRLKAIHGNDVRVLAIGPAGEHRSRIAVLLTDTENAAGQGGYGGVAGSKNLKAIAELGPEQYGETIYHGDRKMPTKISLQEAWGYAGHWSGRGMHAVREFPHWLLEALVWMTATRDPLHDTHIVARDEWMEEFHRDPYEGTKGAEIAIWNEHRSELKSSLTLCDWSFPIPTQSDAESRLFAAVTGIELDETGLDRMGERIKNMQRALLVRNYGRDRNREVSEIMPWFQRPDATKGIVIDEEKFNGLVDTYYKLRGWDVETGRPARNTMENLELDDVAAALEAEEKLPG